MLDHYDKVKRLCFFSFAEHAKEYYIEMCVLRLGSYVGTRPLLENEKHAREYMEDQNRIQHFLTLELGRLLRECRYLGKYGASRHQHLEFLEDTVAPILATRIINDNFEAIFSTFQDRRSSFPIAREPFKRAEAELYEKFENPKGERKDGVLSCDQKH